MDIRYDTKKIISQRHRKRSSVYSCVYVCVCARAREREMGVYVCVRGECERCHVIRARPITDVEYLGLGWWMYAEAWERTLSLSHFLHSASSSLSSSHSLSLYSLRVSLPCRHLDTHPSEGGMSMSSHPSSQQKSTEPSHRQCLPLLYVRPSPQPKHRRCVWRSCVEKRFLGKNNSKK